MKLREIFRFEVRHQLRRRTVWLCLLLLFAFTFLNGAGFDPNEAVHVNAPFFAAFFSVLMGAIWLLIGASVAGEAGARDIHTGVHPLAYTSPVTRAEYLGGRFFGAVAVNALILLFVPIAMMLSLLVADPDPARMGPFRPGAYIATYFLMTLPYVYAVTAIQFSFAVLQRRAMASYVASVLIFITSQFVLMVIAAQLDYWYILRLLDLVGIGGVVFMLGETLTPLQMNTELVALDPTLLVNRAIWLVIASGVLAFTWRRFQFAHPAARTGRRARRRAAQAAAVPVPAKARATPVAVPVVVPRHAPATYARQALGIARTSFLSVAGNRVAVVLAVLVILHQLIFTQELVRFMGVPMFPTTERILGYLTSAVRDVRNPLVIIPLLITYYAGELHWRERDFRMSDITDAAPVGPWTLFLGKLLGLGFLIASLLGVLALAGTLAQLVMGYRQLQPGLFLGVFFGLQLPEYMLFACLALALHTVVNHKYMGHAVVLVVLGLMGFASTFGVRHNLLIYGASPHWSYSQMAGFGESLAPWFAFKLYWAAWALLLAAVAAAFWARGRETSVAARLREARARLTRPTLAAAGAALALIVALGGFVYYNTNVLNDYRSPVQAGAVAAEYERQFRRYADVPQPVLVSTQLQVELGPRHRLAVIQGAHRLVNRTGSPIDSIHVGTVPGERTDEIGFDRRATRVLGDSVLGHSIYTLERPLQPGESLTLRFRVRHAARGFGNSGASGYVVANGTLFGNADLLPAVGYQPQRELRDASDRRAHRLAGAALFPASLYDVNARSWNGHADGIDLDVVIGTDVGQVAVAPGALRRTWTERGRRYFRYTTDAPIRNEYNIFSAKYAVHEAKWNDVAIEIFHHPGHTANLERMVRSVRTSLTRYTREFGPYPYRRIRFIERAGGDGGMSADASTIAYDEGFSHFNPQDPAKGLDLPFYIVAHEVAHQWWGTQVSPAVVEGFWLMSESLAVYSGMQVLRDGYGQDQVRRYLDMVRSIYSYPRTRAAVPLLRANESFLGYRKGAVALYALSRYIGEARVNGALRRMVEKHAWSPPPMTTTLDLHAELKAVTPDSLQPLLHDLFEANTFWELKLVQVDAVRVQGGRWRVTLDVRARKVVVDEAGVEREVPMHDLVEIGVFAGVDEGEHVLRKPLYLALHRIHSGAQRITVTVDREPERGGIDPHHLLIDLNTEDNVERTKQSRAKSPDGLI